MGEPFAKLWDAVSPRVQDLRRQDCYIKRLEESDHEITLCDAYLLPYAASNKYFKEWAEDLVDEIDQAGISESHIPIFFSMVYYGPDEKPTADDWNRLVAFVETWIAETKRNVDLWQQCDLVYCYALGIGRELSVKTSKSVWANTWGSATWAFNMFVCNESTQLRHQLDKANVYNTASPDSENGTFAILDILLNHAPCSCADSYTKRHAKANRPIVEARHQREHRLVAWWDRSGWPTMPDNVKGKRRPEGSFWGITPFIFRDLFGEVPIKKATGSSSIKLATLDKGLLFELLDPQPLVFTTLVCGDETKKSETQSGKCRQVIEDFEHCPKCGTVTPQFKTDTRLRSPDDMSWRKVKTLKCVHCERYFKLIETEAISSRKFCPKCNQTLGNASTPTKKRGNPFDIWLFSPKLEAVRQKSYVTGELATDADYYRDTIELYGEDSDEQFSDEENAADDVESEEQFDDE